MLDRALQAFVSLQPSLPLSVRPRRKQLMQRHFDRKTNAAIPLLNLSPPGFVLRPIPFRLEE